jgi:hypothetical protein
MNIPPALMTDSASATSAWTRLWAESARGSIDLASQDPVSAALRANWAAQLPWLRQCRSVVDVGSGPAVLPLHLMAQDPTGLTGVRWQCVDRAGVPAAVQQALPGQITLYGDTDFATAEPTGDPAQALVSNFGLEYVAHDAVAAACARWLASGGRLHATLHARDSVIDRASATGADDIAFALRDQRLAECADALLVAMASLPADPIDRMMYAVDVRDAYNAAVNALKARMEARGAHSPALIDMLNGVRDLIGWVQQGRGTDARDALARRMAAYAAESVRLGDMQRHALDDARLEALLTQLRAAGFVNVRSNRIDCMLGTVAWTVTAERA